MQIANVNKKLRLLLMIFLAGFIFGIFQGIQQEIKIDIINTLEISKVRIFINTFTMNIWIMLIIWILNNSIINMFITFLKGLTEAICLISFLSNLNEIKIMNLVSYAFYWLMIIPLFIWMIYKVSFDLKNIKTVLISFIVTTIYSLLIAVIN